MTDQKVTAVVTAYNQKDVLLYCLKWLNGVQGIGNIIVIDNGSEDGTAEALSMQGYDYIIFDEGIQGCRKVWNAAVDSFDLEETVVFMNPRYLPGRKCFVRLAETLKKEGAGIAGPLSNGLRYPQYTQMNGADDLLSLDNGGKSEDRDFNVLGLEAGIWAIRKDVLERVGTFQEELAGAENVLLDYGLRMIHRNYWPMVCTSAITYDLLCGNKERSYEEIIGACDREILKRIWKMNYFNLRPHSYLPGLVEEKKETVFRILEVGCDLGANLLEIKNNIFIFLHIMKFFPCFRKKAIPWRRSRLHLNH